MVNEYFWRFCWSMAQHRSPWAFLSFLSLSFIPFLHADSDTELQLKLLNDKMEKAFSRKNDQSYDALDGGQTHWMLDLFDFIKYQQAQKQQIDAHLYFMRPPSLPEFLLRYAIAKENNMFAPPFTPYDDVTESLESNYLYNNNLDSYRQFMIRQFVDFPEVSNVYDPSDPMHLPRGAMYTGSSLVNNLRRVSTIQDMVYKHFHQYCHQGGEDSSAASESEQNYVEVCNTVLQYLQDKTGGVFNPEGISTLNGNADINAQSLMGLSSYLPGTTGDFRARDYIQMITNPTPKSVVPFVQDDLDVGSYKADPTDIEAIAENLIDMSYRSLAQYVLNDLKMRRAKSLPPPSAAGKSSSGSMSVSEYLHQSATSRVKDSNRWVVELSSLSNEALLRELVMIQATSLMFQYQHYLQMENIEALEAAILTSNLRILGLKDMIPSQKEVNQTLNAIQG